MSEARSHRVAVSFTEREHNALQTTAYRTRLPLAGLVARIVRASLESGQLHLPDPVATSVAGSTGSPAARNAPPWLPPLASGDYDDWAQGCAGAVAALIDRYPRELAALADDWAKEAPVREQLWALAIWRRHLDVGTYGDPRTELVFAGALQDFEVYSASERARACEDVAERTPAGAPCRGRGSHLVACRSCVWSRAAWGTPEPRSRAL